MTSKLHSWLASAAGPGSIVAPLRVPVFRRIWSASVLSNLGLFVQSVGAAWAMTQLTTKADLIALVQTATLLPILFTALPAGAFADMYDRRIIGLISVSIAFVGATGLSICMFAGVMTPYLLLSFCLVISAGLAVFGPAWQASVREQVTPDVLPAAFSLTSISYNLARAFGPAIGGAIVAASNPASAFVVNAVCYVPLLIVLFRWRRKREVSRLPPESLGRAIISGLRYIFHSPHIRLALSRLLLTGLAAGAANALAPLIVRDLLHGNAQTFGIILGAVGVGAVTSALNVPLVRRRFNQEIALRVALLGIGLSTALAAVSHNVVVTMIALACNGGSWMMSVSLLNISIQLSSPRWVTARVAAAFGAITAGSLAFGGWGWGTVAEHTNVSTALLTAASVICLPLLVGFRWPMPLVDDQDADAVRILADPEIQLAITGRSGPIVVEIEYRVALAQAREFYDIMLEVQLIRQRNGAYGWSIARDLARPEIWIERFHYPTWHDYLRQRNRSTQLEQVVYARATAMHLGPEPTRVRRMLERPYGSVRRSEDVPDRSPDVIPVTTPTGTGA